MYRLLIISCVVLVVLQQSTSYTKSTQNHDGEQKGVNNTQEKRHVRNGKDWETIDNSNIEEGHVIPDQEWETTDQTYNEEREQVITDKEPETIDQNAKPQNTEKMSTIHSSYNFTNQLKVQKIVFQEAVYSHKKTAEGIGGYMSESVETVENIKKSSEVNENHLSMKTDSGYKKKCTSESIKSEEVIAIFTAICGEPYKPCKLETSGSKTFKKTSVCKPCSCSAKDCQISKNCCPDVEIDNIDADEKDDSLSTSVCTSLSDKLSVQKLEFTVTGNHEISISAKPAASGNAVKDHEKVNPNEVEELQTFSELYPGVTSKEITEAAKSELTTYSFIKNYLELDNMGGKANDTIENLNQTDQMNIYSDKNTLDEKTLTTTSKGLKSSQKRERDSENREAAAKPILTNGNTKQIENKPKQTSESYKQSRENPDIQPAKVDSSSILAKSVSPMYLVTDSCPSEYHDIEVIDKCKNKAPPLLLDNIPVSYWLSTKIYKNKWCAQCHNISFPDFWRLATDCLQLYPTDYLPSMMTDFNELTKNCTVRLFPPPYLSRRTEAQICRTVPNSLTSNNVGKCNVTGLWRENSTAITKLCNQRNYMPHYENRLTLPTTTYKNIFCYICNTLGDLNISEYITHEGEITVANQLCVTNSEYRERRLDIEVKVDDPDTVPQTWSTNNNKLKCPHGQIPDVYVEECIQFECPIHQSALGNICFNRERDVTGLVLASTIHLEFQKPVHVGETLNEIIQFGRQMIAAIDNHMQISRSGCDIRYVKTYANFIQSKQGYIQQMFLVSKLANTKRCSVEQVVRIFTKLRAGKIDIKLPAENNTDFPADSSLFSSSQNTKLSTKLTVKSMSNHTIEIALIQKPVFHEIWLTDKFYCPKVFITSSKYSQLVQQGIFKSIKTEKLASQYVKQSGLIPICYAKYIQPWLLKKYETKMEKQEHYSIAGILSVISITLSMISTILVLITYSIFSELRFISGKLFMVLCFNLLLAEGFYSFGLDLDVGKFWCKLVGICIHFFWIATIFCMNSALWLLLRHIKDPLEPENREFLQSKSNYQVFKYSCYCYVMAALCVLSNIILSHCIYHDTEYGYGDKLCYINSTRMRIITFALPIAFVLLVNFCFFCQIMVSLSQRVQNKYSKVIKAKMLVFLKMSTITGVYWAFGFIYEATQIKAFEYLFIVFNGGQGFFIMWSFLLNKRIFELYKNVCRNIYCKNKTKKIAQKIRSKAVTESSC